MFGVETWGAAKKTLIAKVQLLQDKVTKLSLDKKLQIKSSRQRLAEMNWMNIRQEITFATHTLTYKIMNWGSPQEIESVMPKNTKNLRIESHIKLGTKPRWLTKTAQTRATFRSRSYYYNTLPKSITTQKTLSKFKKELRKHMKSSNQQLWE